MEKILAGKTEILLTNETQISKLGRPFRYSGVELLHDKGKWVDKVFKLGSIYTFRYLDKDEFFRLEFNSEMKFIQKYKVLLLCLSIYL
jgi:hypothetical protein